MVQTSRVSRLSTYLTYFSLLFFSSFPSSFSSSFSPFQTQHNNQSILGKVSLGLELRRHCNSWVCACEFNSNQLSVLCLIPHVPE